MVYTSRTSLGIQFLGMAWIIPHLHEFNSWCSLQCYCTDTVGPACLHICEYTHKGFSPPLKLTPHTWHLFSLDRCCYISMLWSTTIWTPVMWAMLCSMQLPQERFHVYRMLDAEWVISIKLYTSLEVATKVEVSFQPQL